MEGELSSALQQAINASDTSSALVNKTLENLQEATATSVADLVESVYLSARSKDKPAARDGEGGEGGAAGGDAENPALDVIEGMVKQEVEWATGGATSGAAAKAGEKLEEKFEATIERLESAGGLDKSELLEAAWKEMLQSTSAVVKKDEFNTTAVVEAAVAIAKGNAQGALDEVEALKETAASKSVLSRAEQIAALLQGGSPATAAPAPKATPEATRTEPGAAAAGAEGEGGEASLSSLYQSLSKDDDGNWTLKGVDDTQLAAHLGRRGGTLERDIQVAGQRKAKGSLTLDGLWALLTGRSKTSPGADGGGGGGGDAGIPEGRDLGPRKLDYRDNKAHQHMHDTEGELKKEVSTLDAAKRAVAAAGGGEGSHRVHQVRELGEEAGVEAGGEGAAE